MPRNVACAHIPLFLTVLTKAVKMARMNVIFGIGHIYILCGRIHGNAVGYLNLLIGAIGDKTACDHLHLVYIYHGISHLVAHRNVAPLGRYHIQQIAIEPKDDGFKRVSMKLISHLLLALNVDALSLIAV